MMCSYINNLVTTRNPYMEGQQCFPISWYLAIDFQVSEMLLLPCSTTCAQGGFS
jgi:hypothetical protein